MDDPLVDSAAAFLAALRRERRRAPFLPYHLRPHDIDTAYRIQDRLFERLGEAPAGWFLGCTNPHIQAQLGLNGPYASRLLRSGVRESPATVRLPAGFDAVLEVEFAFRLASDLPSRDAPYPEDEVRDAIATVHPAIEVVISYLDDWTHQEVFSLIADNGTDGLLVHGPGVPLETAGALDSVGVTLELNGETTREGAGRDIDGGPLAALTWLANQPARDPGLRAGQIVNTGSCTAMQFAGIGDRALAEFEGIGSVSLEIEAR